MASNLRGSMSDQVFRGVDSMGRESDALFFGNMNETENTFHENEGETETEDEEEDLDVLSDDELEELDHFGDDGSETDVSLSYYMGQAASPVSGKSAKSEKRGLLAIKISAPSTRDLMSKGAKGYVSQKVVFAHIWVLFQLVLVFLATTYGAETVVPAILNHGIKGVALRAQVSMANILPGLSLILSPFLLLFLVGRFVLSRKRMWMRVILVVVLTATLCLSSMTVSAGSKAMLPAPWVEVVVVSLVAYVSLSAGYLRLFSYNPWVVLVFSIVSTLSLSLGLCMGLLHFTLVQSLPCLAVSAALSAAFQVSLYDLCNKHFTGDVWKGVLHLWMNATGAGPITAVICAPFSGRRATAVKA